MGVRNLDELGPILQKIIKRLLANQNLLKLLYYEDADPLQKKDIPPEIINKEIFKKLILFTPYIKPSKNDAKSLISLQITNCDINQENDEFVNFIFTIDVFVPLTQVAIKSDNLRQFNIMGEILKSLKGKNINGIGKIMGGDFSINVITEEVLSYQMVFMVMGFD